MGADWDVFPVLSSRIAQGGVADQSGGMVYGGATESDADIETQVAFGGATADFIGSGVVNGSFAQGPYDRESNVEPVNNPMRYWYGPVLVTGGGITATHVASSNYPSGFGLRLTANAGGNADDDAYFEQVVPFPSGVGRWTGSVVRIAGFEDAPSGTLTSYCALQYLDASGNAVGNATETTDVGAPRIIATAHAQADSSPPSTAQLLRIRIGIRRNTVPVGTTASVTFTDVRCDHAVPYLLIGESNAPSTYSAARVWQETGILNFAANGGTEQFAVADVSGDIPQVIAYSPLDARAELKAREDVVLAGVISPTVSSTQNNWAPAGIATCSTVIVNMDGAGRTITGISATGFLEGQLLILHATNSGGGNLTLSHASGSSTAGNRFSCVGNANAVIDNNGSVMVQYLPTASADNPFKVIESA